MRQFNKNRGVNGSRTIQERALRLAYMITQEAKRRARALTFREKYGDNAAAEAFNVSVRTLYRWQASLRNADGKLEALNPKSRKPQTIRRRIIPPEVERAIVTLRRKHPHMGKDMMTPILKEHYNLDLSVSYVGRCMTTLKKRGTIKDPVSRRYAHKKRATKPRRKEKTGYEVDTVVRFVDGVKTYIITAVHVQQRFAFAFAYRSHSSRTAADFLDKLIHVSPMPVTHLQTDNGSEFAKEFAEACRLRSITHYYTYPRSPKMNAFIERFNRTLTEEFLMYHRALMRDDIAALNEALVDYLLWYNTNRPHSSLGYVSPLRYYVSTLKAKDCQMWWTSTVYCAKNVVIYNGL